MFYLYSCGNVIIFQDSQVAKRYKKMLNFISHQGNAYPNHNVGQEMAQQVNVPAVHPQLLLYKES